MRTFAIIDGGAIANVIVAPADWPEGRDITDVVPRPGIGWRENANGGFDPPPEHAPEIPDTRRLVTQRAFRGRIAIAELVGIEIASLDDPAAPMEQRQQAATLRVLLETLKSAQFVDLDFIDTRLGLQTIGQFGLLSAQRVAEILDAPVQDFERP